MILKNNIKYIFTSITILLVSSSTVKAEEFEAILLWSKRVELSTPVNGLVQNVFTQAGKIVAKGETLVQLDPRSFKADLQYAKAAYKNADEQNQEAKRELDRQTDMYERTMLSDHELQIAKNNYTSTQAQLHQSKSNLTKAQLNLEYSAIRAPFNAIVISSKAVKGQVVAAEISPPVLVVVAEAHRMLARFYAGTKKISSLLLNQGVSVSIDGNIFQGKIFNIALEPENAKADHYAVDVIFDSKDKILRAGQKVKVEL